MVFQLMRGTAHLYHYLGQLGQGHRHLLSLQDTEHFHHVLSGLRDAEHHLIAVQDTRHHLF